jgi:hypothetical protein
MPRPRCRCQRTDGPTCCAEPEVISYTRGQAALDVAVDHGAVESCGMIYMGSDIDVALAFLRGDR